MKYYVIKYENGLQRECEFNNYDEALNYAESGNGGWDFNITEYDSQEEAKEYAE